MSPFGDLLKAHRTAAGLSQFKLGIRAGVSQRLISEYERGNHAPQRKTILTLAAALDLSPEDQADLLSAAGHDAPTVATLTRERDAALETCAALRDTIARKEALVQTNRAAYMRLLRRTQDAEREVERITADRRSEGACASSGGIEEQYAVSDIEVTRLRRLLAALREDGETHAELINKLLNGVTRLTQQAEQVAGIGKGKRHAA